MLVLIIIINFYFGRKKLIIKEHYKRKNLLFVSDLLFTHKMTKISKNILSVKM